jgi:hypothetical protein
LLRENRELLKFIILCNGMKRGFSYAFQAAVMKRGWIFGMTIPWMHEEIGQSGGKYGWFLN